MTADLHSDDFPSSPNATIDSRRYFEAFLAASGRLDELGKSIKGADLSACLMEMTAHAYERPAADGVLYRRRGDASDVLCDLWLSRVRHLAKWLIVSNGTPQCHGLGRDILNQLPRKFAEPDSIRLIPSYLALFGIVLVIEPAIKGMKMDGAVFRAPTGQVVIGLSLRYRRLDHFWFSLMHELAHVCLHLDRLDSPILDDFDVQDDSDVESEANRLASIAMIPSAAWRSNPVKFNPREEVVREFAAKLGIAPQIVAGRFQRESNRYDILAGIVNEVDVRKVFG